MTPKFFLETALVVLTFVWGITILSLIWPIMLGLKFLIIGITSFLLYVLVVAEHALASGTRYDGRY